MSHTNKNRGRNTFDKFKWIFNFLEKILLLLPRTFRSYLFKRLRNKQGYSGLGLRYLLIKTLAIDIGNNVSIHPGVFLLNPEKLVIGDNVSIHPLCYIDASGEIVIGNDVSIAHGVTILSTSHGYTQLDIPIKDQKITASKTTISDDIWIGAKATILNGTNIGNGSVIAASAVVTTDVPQNSVVAGVPSKVIKKR